MRSLGLFLFCLMQFSCGEGQVTPKINGISFVGSRDKITQINVDPVTKINANFAAIMPFGFLRSPNNPKVIFNTDRQWFGETRAGAKQYIGLLQKNGIQIMLKPQLWIWQGEFTGTIKMKSETDWKQLENTYADFILTYAKLAQETNVAIYCIGTELEGFVKNRPRFWSDLIARVKKVYKGKLTYAANWDEYPRVPFWEQMDYIGVDAYFPLSEEKHPSQEQMGKGWQKWKSTLKDLAEQKAKPILFTEFGYRSMDYTAKKPWLVDRNQMDVNLDAQADAIAATFNEFWKENWFAGGFVWKWFIHHDRSGGAENNRFTPQNKPSETVIKNFFGDQVPKK